jgi:signal transduction histidine kinase
MYRIFYFVFILIKFIAAQSFITIDEDMIADLPVIGYEDILPINYKVSKYEIYDINADGQNEYVIYGEGEPNFIDILDKNFERLQHIPIFYDLKEMVIIDVDKDSIAEIITFGLEDKFKGMIYKYRQIKNNIMLTVKTNIFQGEDKFQYGRKDNKYDLEFARFHKLPEDFDNIILQTITGYDLFPRGLFLLDLVNMSVKWERFFGSSPAGLIIEKGKDDWYLVMTTNAPSNGYSLNGYADSTSHLLKIDSKGNIHYSELKSIGDFFYSWISKFILPDQIQRYIYYTGSSSSLRKTPNLVQIIDPSSLAVESEIKLRSSPAKPLNSDICLEKIYTVYNYGDILQMNLDLKKERIFRFMKRKAGLILACDLNSDWRTEYIILFDKQPRMLFTDHKFNFVGVSGSHYQGTDFYNAKFNKAEDIINFYYSDDQLYKLQIPISNLRANSFVESLVDKIMRQDKRNVFLVLMLIISSILFVVLLIFMVKYLVIRDFYQYFFSTQSWCMIIMNRDMRILNYNSNFNKVFKGLDNITGKKLDQISKLKPFGELFSAINESLYNYKGGFAERELSLNINGHKRQFQFSIRGRSPFLKIHYFIIEIKDLTYIPQSQLIVAWSSLAQRVAHEIKNPLSTILLSIRQLQKKLKNLITDKGNTQIDQYINSAIEEIERLKKTSNQFMRFTSTLEDQYAQININSLLKSIVSIFNQSNMIKFEMQLSDNLPDIYYDEQKVRQIFYNIIENSLDAIDGEGEIVISTSLRELSVPGSEKLARSISVEIMDSGSGIQEEDVNRIFEANFTTKSTGTGFGLAITKLIIEQFKGDIFVRSQKGIGTTITVCLPINVEPYE